MYEQKSPMEARKHIRHSIIVLSLVRLIMCQYCYDVEIYFRDMEPLMHELSVNVRANDYQASRFFDAAWLALYKLCP